MTNKQALEKIVADGNNPAEWQPLDLVIAKLNTVLTVLRDEAAITRDMAKAMLDSDSEAEIYAKVILNNHEQQTESLAAVGELLNDLAGISIKTYGEHSLWYIEQ